MKNRLLQTSKRIVIIILLTNGFSVSSLAQYEMTRGLVLEKTNGLIWEITEGKRLSIYTKDENGRNRRITGRYYVVDSDNIEIKGKVYPIENFYAIKVHTKLPKKIAASVNIAALIAVVYATMGGEMDQSSRDTAEAVAGIGVYASILTVPILWLKRKNFNLKKKYSLSIQI